MSRTKKWCFTLNNYTAEDCQKIEAIECEYLIYGKEVGDQGTPHLQGFIYFTNRRTFNTVKKLLGDKCHIEAAKGSIKENIAYCSKDGDVFIKGVEPEEQNEKGGQATKRKWEDAQKAAKEGRFEDIPPDLWIRYRNSFKQEYQEQRIESVKVIDGNDKTLQKHFFWIWGPTGTGKSHLARQMAKQIAPHEEPFLKQLNKWWSGYKMQKVVIIEELSPNICNMMASYFKNWCDKWPFSAETKGGAFEKGIRPEYIIMTSNYSIDDCFENAVDRDAMKRKCKEIFKKSRDEFQFFPIDTQSQSVEHDEPDTQALQVRDPPGNQQANSQISQEVPKEWLEECMSQQF